MLCSSRNKPLIFIGARASGKSTLGRVVAARLGWEFCDTDDVLQCDVGMSIAEFVSCHGWPAFRREEARVLRAVCAERTVIATGGGCVLARENRDFMRARGLVCYLRAPAHIFVQRLRVQRHEAMRPALTGGTLVEEVAAVVRKRHPLYSCAAHVTLDAALPLSYLSAAVHKIFMKRTPFLH